MIRERVKTSFKGIKPLDMFVIFLVAYVIGTQIVALDHRIIAIFLLGTSFFLLIMKRPVFGLYLIAAITPLNQLQQLDYPLFSSVIRIIGLVTLISFLAKHFIDAEYRFIKTELFLPMGVFVFAHIIGLFRSHNLNSALAQVTGLTMYFMLYFLTVNLIKDQKAIRKMLLIITIIASGLALLGIVQYFRGKTLFPPEMGMFGSFDIEGQSVIRIIGVFRNPNAFAYTYVLVIPLVVGLLLIQKKRLYQCVLLALLGICTICLLLTFSRSAFLAVWISLFFILAVLKRSQKAMIAMGFLGIFILFYAVSPDLFRILQFRVTSTSSDIGIQQRLELIRGGMDTFTLNPLIGSGTGNAPMMLGKYTYRFIRGAHNNLIAVLVETGLLGFIPFILIFLNFTKKILNAMSRTNNHDLKIILVALLASICGYFINGLFHTSIAYGLWWIILGLGIAASGIVEYHNQGNLTLLKE